MFYQHRACIETIILQLLSTLPWQISLTIQTHDWKIFISTIHLLTPCHHLCNFLIRPIYFCDECIDIFRWYCLSQFDLVWFLRFSAWIYEMNWSSVLRQGRWCRRCYRIPEHSSPYTAQRHLIFYENLSNPSLDSDHSTAGRCCRAGWAGDRWRAAEGEGLHWPGQRSCQPPSSQYTKHPENVSFFSHKDCLLKMATLTHILHIDKNINQTSTNMTRGGREEMDDAFTHTI